MKADDAQESGTAQANRSRDHRDAAERRAPQDLRMDGFRHRLRSFVSFHNTDPMERM